jgi:hypothetical protein
MDLVRTTDGLRGSLTQSQKPDLPGLDQFGHRADGVFDRHRGVYPVQIVQIDVIDSQTLE